MTKQGIQDLARTELSDLLEKPGSILYSSHETLKSGDVYLLGFNPGGAGGNPIKLSIDTMLSYETNAYLDECWENGKSSWEKGEAPLQKRVSWLLEEIGLNPREVCASNLIFFQSRKAKDIEYSLADICWPIHEAILDIVKPKVIIAFGNSGLSSYAYLHSKFGGQQEYKPSGHGNWRLKGFKAIIDGKAIFIAGLPHLSRYSPIGKTRLVEWLKSKLRI